MSSAVVRRDRCVVHLRTSLHPLFSSTIVGPELRTERYSEPGTWQATTRSGSLDSRLFQAVHVAEELLSAHKGERALLKSVSAVGSLSGCQCQNMSDGWVVD